MATGIAILVFSLKLLGYSSTINCFLDDGVKMLIFITLPISQYFIIHKPLIL